MRPAPRLPWACPQNVRAGWRLGPSGKPDLGVPGGRLRVNLSHSADLALLAITERREIGVDIEHVRDDLPVEALAARYFPPAEAARVLAASGPERIWWFLRIWTRKEACVKASGARLTQGLGLPVGGPPYGPGRGLRCQGSGAVAGNWIVRDLPLVGGSVGAVALAGTEDYHVLVRTWPGACRLGATTWHDRVRFDDVSPGYPREWGQRRTAPALCTAFPDGS